MKKIFYLASIAALAFSSCAKDETTEANLGTVGGSKIVAAMEADDTRSELVQNGSGYEIVWKATDGLSVFSNGEGNQALPNVLFQLDNASDGLAAGAFNSKVANLNAKNKYVAVYPYNDAYDFTPTWDRVEYPGVNGYETKGLLAYNKIKATIPAKQIYVPGSFNTNTISAISTEFTVGEDNTATVKMQPVVDYLMVDIVATDEIKTLSLNLYEGDAVDANLVNIAGTGVLSAYKVGDKTRYYLSDASLNGTDVLNDKTITLDTKQLAGDVSLATPNTYVFVIPGGILGNNRNITAEIYVNGRQGANKLSFDVNGDGYNDVSNINYYGPSNNRTYRSKNADNRYTSYSDLVYYNYNLENTVFYLNAKNAAGARVPFTYNPKGDYLINNELDLFYYFANYGVSGSKAYQKDAYVAEGATFDLSIKHMSELVEEINNTTYPGLNSVINAYIMSGKATFPTIATYSNEFLGNGAALTNIERPLAGENGLFGELSGKVKNLKLANIEAKSWVDEDDDDNDGDDEEILKGVVLAKAAGNNITDITVSNLDADAVIGSGNLKDYKQIKIGEGGVDGDLNHIVGTLNMTGSYTYTAEAWAAVSTVGESVFHTITPDANGDTNADVNHTVATLPEGAAYNKFVCEVSYPSGYSKVLSVLIGDVSYWTGGKINNADPAYGTTKPILVKYAEQFANGEKSTTIAHQLTRSMNLNYTNTEISWTAPEYTTLVGGENIVVSDLVYVAAAPDQNASDDAAVAPFAKLTNVSGIKFDGITIDIETPSGKVVPRKISGLANSIEKIEDVTINNLVIDAYSLANNNDVINDPHYYDGSTKQRYVGYLSAVAEDINAKNVTINGVKSNVQALTAAVACLDLTTMNAYFNNVDLTGTIVKAKGQEDIKEFALFNGYKYNLAGTLVGLAANKSASNNPYEVGVKFNGCTPAQPVFLFSTTKNEKAIINVLYNDNVAKTLSHPDLEE